MEKDNDTNNLIKIDNNYLENISTKSVLPFFGNWTQNIDKLKEQYLNADPFEHIVIDNFLEESYADKISHFFPKLDNTWHKYLNPIEVKYTFDDIIKVIMKLA